MSVTVTSQTKQRPSRHGMRVKPSGRLPSDLSRPAGSFVARILALVSERSTMSLRWLGRVKWPEVCLHDSACEPLTSTTDPQIHTWGLQMLMPRRRPTAILTTSSSNLNPLEEMGMACSQSLLCYYYYYYYCCCCCCCCYCCSCCCCSYCCCCSCCYCCCCCCCCKCCCCCCCCCYCHRWSLEWI